MARKTAINLFCMDVGKVKKRLDYPQAQWKQPKKKQDKPILFPSYSTVLPEAMVQYRELGAVWTRQAYVG